MDPDEQNSKLIEKIYTDFLDDEQRGGIYYDKINSLIKSQNIRLIVNINDLRNSNNERAYNLINKASGELLAFQRAVKNLILLLSPNYGKSQEEFYIGLEGSFGSHHLTPRTLSSKYLGQIICMEGIVTKCSLIRPKVIRSVHYCIQTGKSFEKKYFDLTSLEPQPSGSIYPTKDEDGNLLVTEYGLSTYKDHQIITLQEVPEKAPPGQLPRSVDVICDDDLIDICKPGDRVQIVGFYRSLPGKKEGFTTATFRTVLIANNVLELTKDISPNISSYDIAKIKRLRDDNPADIFEILAQSLAPSIHGHEFVKRAILCMLLGGVEKVLPNGTRLRGDINVLLIGDPSVAKSQILRYVLKTAPRAVATTGRGSSGVGLTAAVVTDMDTGVNGIYERRLEAGAMVLADRGIVCIDEFDKMSDADRTAIHEVMEQGRVTVAKAGIHARLNARCSVLAAANPVYGRYDQYKTPMENIGMQDSLLSRFDLLFIILDQSDTEQDRIISNHIVKVHQYRAPGEKEGEVFSNKLAEADFYNTSDLYKQAGNDEIIGSAKDNAQNEGDMLYEKCDHLQGANSNEKYPIVSSQFMKKYLHLARKVTPQLSEKSTAFISQEYVKLRAQSSIMVDNMARTQPITPRTLETIIRLSTAHAKARLSKTVDLEDAEAAVNLVQYAYFKKVISKPKNAKISTQISEENIELSEDGKCEQSMDFTESTSKGSLPLKDTAAPVLLNDERFKSFKRRLLHIFDDSHTESIDISIVKDRINDGLNNDLEIFDPFYVDGALKIMSDANQIMIDGGTIFKI